MKKFLVIAALSANIYSIAEAKTDRLSLTTIEPRSNQSIDYHGINEAELSQLEVLSDYGVRLYLNTEVLANIKENHSIDLQLPEGVFEVVPRRVKSWFGEFTSISGVVMHDGVQIGVMSVVASEYGLSGALGINGRMGEFVSAGNSVWYMSPEKLSYLKGLYPEVTVIDYENHDGFVTALDRDAKKIKQPSIESSSGIVTLDVALVLSSTYGSSNSSVNNALGLVTVANDNFIDSSVDVRLDPAIVTRVIPSVDSSRVTPYLSNTNTLLTKFVSAGPKSYMDLLWDKAKYSLDTGDLNIHQFTLLVGTGSSTICGLAEASPNGHGDASVVRATSNPGCPSTTTYVHEIGHNMTLTHSDGVLKEQTIDGITETWKSVMFQGVSPGQVRKYFTGGQSGSVVDNNICFGTCNASPWPNSINKLESAKNTTKTNKTFITKVASTNSADSFENDDSEAGASYRAGFIHETHNFYDDSTDWLRTSGNFHSINKISLDFKDPGIEVCAKIYRVSTIIIEGLPEEILLLDSTVCPINSDLTMPLSPEVVIKFYEKDNVTGINTRYTISNPIIEVQ